MAFIKDESGDSEYPYIIMTSSEKELLKCKHAAIAAKEGTILRVDDISKSLEATCLSSTEREALKVQLKFWHAQSQAYVGFEDGPKGVLKVF